MKLDEIMELDEIIVQIETATRKLGMNQQEAMYPAKVFSMFYLAKLISFYLCSEINQEHIMLIYDRIVQYEYTMKGIIQSDED